MPNTLIIFAPDTYPGYIDGVDKSFTTEDEARAGRMNEHKRSQPPRKSDMRRIKGLLSDFGLDLRIPPFKTLAELDDFRRLAIAAALS